MLKCGLCVPPGCPCRPPTYRTADPSLPLGIAYLPTCLPHQLLVARGYGLVFLFRDPDALVQEAGTKL